MSEEEITEKIEILRDLQSELDDYDKHLDAMFTNKEYSYNDLMDSISPEERTDLNWNLNYLKLHNIDPRDHEVKDEMKRVQDYFGKIKEAKDTAHNLANQPQVQSNINKEACDRIIKNLINGAGGTNRSANNTVKENKSKK